MIFADLKDSRTEGLEALAQTLYLRYTTSMHPTFDRALKANVCRVLGFSRTDAPSLATCSYCLCGRTKSYLASMPNVHREANLRWRTGYIRRVAKHRVVD